MNHRENEILIIQTSDSSSLFITKDYFPYDDTEIETLCYSIREGDNPLYWLDDWHTDLQAVINLVEFPHRNVAGKRDYISWWLNCRPSFVDETIKSFLKQRLELYHLTGEIQNAFQNARYGLEFNSDCLLEWHKILNVVYDKKLLELIPKEDNSWYQKTDAVTIHFEGFKFLPYISISLKIDAFDSFQKLLDYLYGFIMNDVNQLSYNKEWILFNTRNGLILQKDKILDRRPLNEIEIKDGDKIICFKK
jgi:hypothetical protein